MFAAVALTEVIFFLRLLFVFFLFRTFWEKLFWLRFLCLVLLHSLRAVMSHSSTFLHPKRRKSNTCSYMMYPCTCDEEMHAIFCIVVEEVEYVTGRVFFSNILNENT